MFAVLGSMKFVEPLRDHNRTKFDKTSQAQAEGIFLSLQRCGLHLPRKIFYDDFNSLIILCA